MARRFGVVQARAVRRRCGADDQREGAEAQHLDGLY